MTTRVDYSPRFRFAAELLLGTYSACIVYALLSAPASFGELYRGLPGIGRQLLRNRLQELHVNGLVETVPQSGPDAGGHGRAASLYRLTERGRSLSPVISAIAEWAAEDHPAQEGRQWPSTPTRHRRQLVLSRSRT